MIDTSVMSVCEIRSYQRQLISLAYHNDWKLSKLLAWLSKGDKIHLPA